MPGAYPTPSMWSRSSALDPSFHPPVSVRLIQPSQSPHYHQRAARILAAPYHWSIHPLSTWPLFLQGHWSRATAWSEDYTAGRLCNPSTAMPSPKKKKKTSHLTSTQRSYVSIWLRLHHIMLRRSSGGLTLRGWVVKSKESSELLVGAADTYLEAELLDSLTTFPTSTPVKFTGQLWSSLDRLMFIRQIHLDSKATETH